MKTIFRTTYFCPSIFLPKSKHYVADKLSPEIDNDMLQLI
jgi:hypothetical protein